MSAADPRRSVDRSRQGMDRLATVLDERPTGPWNSCSGCRKRVQFVLEMVLLRTPSHLLGQEIPL
jgi:hypothetical protein